MIIMMLIQYIAILFAATTDTTVGQEVGLYKHSLLISAMPTTTVTTNKRHIYIVNMEPSNMHRIDVENVDSLNVGFNAKAIMSIDVNYQRRKLYMHELRTSTIYGVSDFKWETSFTGMSIRPVHTGISISSNVKIAVDWVSDNVYWVDPVFRWIAVQSGDLQLVDQSNYKVIVEKDLKNPIALAVDPIHGFIFWSDVGKVVKIEKSNMVGENRTAILSTGLILPSAIYVDITTSEIYWVDRIEGTIEGANFNGSNRRFVKRIHFSTFLDLVVIGNIIFVTDLEDNRVYVINKQTGADIDKLRVNGSKVLALGLYTPYSQPNKSDFCPRTGCSDLCVNMPTCAQCLCREGYQLNADNRTCTEVEGEYHRAVVVAGPGSICMTDIRSLATDKHQKKSNCFLNITEEKISFLDLDMINRKIYYATDIKIYSKIIDHTSAPVQLAVVKDTITGLSLNWRNGNIYWSIGQSQGRIEMFSQSTMSIYTLLESGLFHPRGLIVLPLDSLMIWINGDSNNCQIEKADMDSSSRETIVNSAYLNRPVSITIDPTTHTMYWTDLGTIKKCNLDGTGIRSLEVNALSVQLVTIYKNYLIFTEKKLDGTHVKSGDLQAITVSNADVPVPEVGVVTCLKVLDAHLQPSKIGPCDVFNGDCEHICLPSGETHLCKCEYGFILDANRKTCSSAFIENNFLLVIDRTNDQIYQVSLDNDEVHGLDTIEIEKPTGIGMNQKTKQIVWGDMSKKIHRINFDGTGYEMIASLAFIGSRPRRLAIDHSTGNMYYTAVLVDVRGFVGVGVLSPDGRHHQLIRNKTIVLDIVLDPEDGYLFWSGYSESPFVNRANMDGTSIVNIISLKIAWPGGLAIDQQENNLYLMDSVLGTIQKCTYSGICREIYKSENDDFSDVVLLGEYLYFTARDKRYITKLNQNDTTDIEVLARKPELGWLDALVVYKASLTTYTESAICSKENGGCSTFCFPTESGRVCGCEDGVSLGSDGKTCSNVRSPPPPTTTRTTMKSILTTSSGPKVTSQSSGGDSLPISIISGAAAGCGVLLIIIVVLIVLLRKRTFCIRTTNNEYIHPAYCPSEIPLTPVYTEYIHPAPAPSELPLTHVYNQYIYPVPAPSDTYGDDRPNSGAYDLIDDIRGDNAEEQEEGEEEEEDGAYDLMDDIRRDYTEDCGQEEEEDEEEGEGKEDARESVYLNPIPDRPHLQEESCVQSDHKNQFQSRQWSGRYQPNQSEVKPISLHKVTFRRPKSGI